MSFRFNIFIDVFVLMVFAIADAASPCHDFAATRHYASYAATYYCRHYAAADVAVILSLMRPLRRYCWRLFDLPLFRRHCRCRRYSFAATDYAAATAAAATPG